MAAFVDKTGQSWPVELDFGLLELVKREAGVDLAAAMAAPDSLLPELLFGDPGKLVAVLWVVCDPTAKNPAITPEQWGRLFNGSAIESAAQAVIEAIADFFPRSAVARAMKARLGEMLAAVDAKAIREIDRAFSNWAAASAVSSASIPGP